MCAGGVRDRQRRPAFVVEWVNDVWEGELASDEETHKLAQSTVSVAFCNAKALTLD